MNRITVTCMTVALAVVLMRMPSRAATITVNTSNKHQVIEGIGGMAAMVPWFEYGPYYNDDWLNLVVDSFGLSMFRTEFYARPEDGYGEQGIEKQIPFWQALHAKAISSGAEIRTIATVWSPPGYMKSNGSTLGGSLANGMEDTLGGYLADYVFYFNEQCGFPLYSLSVQNEPEIGTAYNSCSYDPQGLGDAIIATANKFAARNVPCKINYADDIAGWYDWNHQVTQRVITNHIADSIASVLSVHYGGPGDESWFAEYGNGGTQYGKTVWNTEYGNGSDDWNGGAWDNAQSMCLLFQNNFSAIVYWILGPHPNQDQWEESVMVDPANPGPKARVLQAYARVIKPDAYRVDASSNSNNVMCVAFVHEQHQTVTVVLVNTGSATNATISGDNLPAQWDVHQTSPSQNFEYLGSMSPETSVNLPSKSITSFYNVPTISKVIPPRERLMLQRRAGDIKQFTIDGKRMAGRRAAMGARVRVDATARGVLGFQVNGR